MLAHVVYFETLASIDDELVPAWKATAAGLVVLRLIDDWLDAGAQIVTTDVTGLRAIRDAVAAVSEGDPIRSILNGTVEAIANAETSSIGIVASHLMAYGRALHYAGQWGLAKDVFTTLMRRAEDVDDSETLIHAALRLGFVTRRKGEHEESEAAYMVAEEESLSAKNWEGQTRARLGIAQNAIDRGNLPKADELLEEVVSTARTHKLDAVMADALQDRARLHHNRGDFAGAVRFGYSALEFAQDLSSRDRILGDVAASFAELGNWTAAKDAHLIVAATTQEEWLRQQTLINLMDIAILEKQEIAFHQYRRTLADCSFQPLMQAYFHLYTGKGYRTFENFTKAGKEFDRAIEIATQFNFHQLAHSAEAEAAKTDVASVQKAPQEWSNELKEIASAIGNLRELTQAEYKVGATA